MSKTRAPAVKKARSTVPLTAGDEALLKTLLARIPGADVSRLRDAFAVCREAYAGREHWTGMPVMDHVTAVLAVFLEFRPHEDAIIACLLHHVIEMKSMTLLEMEERYGSTVRSLVSGVHLLSLMASRPTRASVEHLRLMFLQLADDPYAVLMVLCERVAILEQLSAGRFRNHRQFLQSTLRVFAPVAARLGIYSLKHRLESLAFPLLYPTDAERIQEQLDAFHERHGVFLPEASRSLAAFLAEHGIEAVVEAREKQLFSIFAKMQSKSINSIEDIYDLFAFRVIVGTEEECYRALGLLHRTAHPLPNRFKDLIAFPKPNGYRSLHTTLSGLPGLPPKIFVEVQIRTERMHREAEFGIAAHWSYKEGGSAEQALARVQLQRAFAQQEFVRDERGTQGLADHIFVLTPKGDVIELPEGATPLDFAFSVHTEIGLAFRMAKVNGSVVPLDYHLENGDVVEVLRHPEPNPSPRWLKLLRTASARSRLRHYLAASGNQDFARDEGSERTVVVTRRRQTSTMLVRPVVVEMEGGIPLSWTFARCCKPEKERTSAIVGIVSRTGGTVRIHRDRCKALRDVSRERRMKVWWKK